MLSTPFLFRPLNLFLHEINYLQLFELILELFNFFFFVLLAEAEASINWERKVL
jgi:hypothetical protein